METNYVKSCEIFLLAIYFVVASKEAEILPLANAFTAHLRRRLILFLHC